MKFGWIDVIVIVLLIVVAFMLYDNAQEIKSEGYACKINPFVYGAKEYSRLNNGDLQGTASFIGGGPPVILRFDKNNLSIEDLQAPSGSLNMDINFSNVNLK